MCAEAPGVPHHPPAQESGVPRESCLVPLVSSGSRSLGWAPMAGARVHAARVDRPGKGDLLHLLATMSSTPTAFLLPLWPEGHVLPCRDPERLEDHTRPGRSPPVC